jgi:probable phosphoglycerate mutase
MEAYLIRHGETEQNVDNTLIGGRSNHLPINPKGEEQARKLGERLKRGNVTFDSVYASIALRTLQTATRVCEVMGFPTERIVQSDKIQELSQGDWEGKPRKEVYTEKVMASIRRDPWNFRNASGESQKMAEDRMLAWLNSLLEPPDSKPEHVIAAFTHGLAIRCLLRGLLNFDCRKTYLMETGNTSITKVRFNGKCWVPITINDTAHL